MNKSASAAIFSEIGLLCPIGKPFQQSTCPTEVLQEGLQVIIFISQPQHSFTLPFSQMPAQFPPPKWMHLMETLFSEKHFRRWVLLSEEQRFKICPDSVTMEQRDTTAAVQCTYRQGGPASPGTFNSWTLKGALSHSPPWHWTLQWNAICHSFHITYSYVMNM